jgi:hypothetical protein
VPKRTPLADGRGALVVGAGTDHYQLTSDWMTVKILFVGPIWTGSNATSLARGLREDGHDVTIVDTAALNQLRRYSADWAYAKAFGKRRPGPTASVVDKLRRSSSEQRFDALIAFKAIHLPQQEILALPIPIKVHYSPDDVSNPANTTDDYLQYEPGWDLIVTTKKHNVPEIADRGGRPLFVWSAYDQAWHRPWPTRLARQFQVGFIGAWRADRDELLRNLVGMYRRSFRLAGPRWSGRAWSKATLTGPVYGEDFSITIAETFCNLVLLNSDNRDQHTCRSFEVPASGGLFVGERTPEHEEMLEDGKECLLFSGHSELMEQLDWALTNPIEADNIRAAGHRRITSGNNTYAARGREIVEAIT